MRPRYAVALFFFNRQSLLPPSLSMSLYTTTLHCHALPSLAHCKCQVKKLEEEQVAQREDHKHNLVAAQKSHDAALDELKAEMELKLTEFKEDQEERRKQFEEDPEVKEALLHPHPLAAPPPQFPPQFDIHPEPMPELIKDVPLDDPVAENERRQERVCAAPQIPPRRLYGVATPGGPRECPRATKGGHGMALNTGCAARCATVMEHQKTNLCSPHGGGDSWVLDANYPPN